MDTTPGQPRPFITGFLVLPQPYLDQLFGGTFATARRRRRITRHRGDTWTG